MEYNYSKLLGRIKEKCGGQIEFARKMGISERTVSLKLNNKIPWKQTEISKASEILDFSTAEIQSYFFCFKSSSEMNK